MKITLIIDHPLIEYKYTGTALTLEEAKKKLINDLETFGYVVEELEG